MVQAALGEQGLALGWMGLVDPLLSTGILALAGPTLEAPDRGYFPAAAEKPLARERRARRLDAGRSRSLTSLSSGGQILQEIVTPAAACVVGEIIHHPLPPLLALLERRDARASVLAVPSMS